MVIETGFYTTDPYKLIETISKNMEEVFKAIEKEKAEKMATKKKTSNEEEYIIPEEKIKEMMKQKENVNHPSWYGSKDDPYETIKVIQAWGLNFPLGNAIKYISRAGKKDPTKTVEDLRKALFYIQYEIDRIERDGNRN